MMCYLGAAVLFVLVLLAYPAAVLVLGRLGFEREWNRQRGLWE